MCQSALESGRVAECFARMVAAQKRSNPSKRTVAGSGPAQKPSIRAARASSFRCRADRPDDHRDPGRGAIDVARVGALVLVVLGHLALAIIDRNPDGTLRGANVFSLYP